MKKDFDNFDEFAKDYRDIHNENIKLSGADSSYFAEHKVLEVSKEEQSGGALRILDIGCGDGISAVFFNQHFPSSAYEGIDVSEESIKEAESRKVPTAAFKIYDGFHIPFPDAHFDVVFIACVLHHILPEHHLQLLTEARRVMKPGGRIYIFEHNPYNPVTRRIVNTCVFDKDAILLNPPYAKNVLKKAGFTSVGIFFTLFFPRGGVFKKILGLEKYLTWLPLGGQYFAKAGK